MTTPEKLATHQKALHINLDAKKYGTFAEIGAGQEVARWFFHVGGAAGTVAKTISAYDMGVSDAIYGTCERYVSRQRLVAMLNYEYNLAVERLQATRGSKCQLFAFANTVATRSYTRHEDGHGWLGVRFQTECHGEPSEIIVHVRLLDLEAVREQEALGVLGVNLLYAAFYQNQQPEVLIGALLDQLDGGRIEVDMIRFSGPAFAKVDNRLMSLQLVHQGLTEATMFTAEGEVVQAADALYKKAVLIERGSFRPIINTTLDMLERAQEQIVEEPEMKGESPLVLMEMTLRSLVSESGIDHQDFLARVDTLSALGKTVMISNFRRYYRLAGYLGRYTHKRTGIVLGIPSLREIFDEKFYTDLEGGLLESLGKLFRNEVKLYAYPWRDPATGEVITAANLEVAPHLRKLYAFLLDNGSIRPILRHNIEYLPISSRDVLSKIQCGNREWEKLVPPAVVAMIKQNGFFGYQEQPMGDQI